MLDIVPFFLFLLPISVVIFVLVRQYRVLPKLDGFTEHEKSILAKQLLALLIFTPFLLIIAVLLAMGWSFVTITRIALSLGSLSLGYIAITSIINQVSILRGRGQHYPSKGKIAVVHGAFAIIVVIGTNLFILFR